MKMDSQENAKGGRQWVYIITVFANDGCGYFLQSSNDVYTWRSWPVYVALILA